MHRTFILSFCREIDKIAQEQSAPGAVSQKTPGTPPGGGPASSKSHIRTPKPPKPPGLKPLRMQQGMKMKGGITSKPKGQMPRYASVKDLAEAIEKGASIEELEKDAFWGSIVRGIAGAGKGLFGLARHHPKATIGLAGGAGAAYGASRIISGAKGAVEAAQERRRKKLPKKRQNIYGGG